MKYLLRHTLPVKENEKVNITNSPANIYLGLDQVYLRFATLREILLSSRESCTFSLYSHSLLLAKTNLSLTCSAFNVNSMKICCNFSFTKLIQNCSNPFFYGKKICIVWYEDIINNGTITILSDCIKKQGQRKQ